MTSRWSDAVTAALIFAVDPIGTGIVLRARAGPVRERWLGVLHKAMPSQTIVKAISSHIPDGRLLGGLDLERSLQVGKPVAAKGLLAEADGGIVIVGMAERLPSSTTSHLTAALDQGFVRVERDGISMTSPARFGVIAIDEGLEDEAAPRTLSDRLAIHLDLDAIAWGDANALDIHEDVAEIRPHLASTAISADQIEAFCHIAMTLGIASLRAPLQALRVARAAATLAARRTLDEEDIAVAARLVFAPRATVLPQSEPNDETSQPPPPDDKKPDQDSQSHSLEDLDRALDEIILAAAQAAIPADVLASLREGRAPRRGRGAGQSGALQRAKVRGRPTGTRRGDLRSGGKLNIIETLRAAAPWQKLRRQKLHCPDIYETIAERVIIRPDDFRITRFRQRSETATIFVVDASGSAALHRLAEAKGAVELLLADCYVRRDQVALIAFRGMIAEILLPPTRSLARAKRSLAGLPGGGGTPLAAGLDAAFSLADSIHRRGQTPSVVLLTDGRANIARDGSPGRPRAEQDAELAAKAFQAAGIASVLVDTSARPTPSGAHLAKTMGARYLPLPYADAAALSHAVKAAVRHPL